MSNQILKFILICIASLFFTAEVQAYTPPIGIPDPGMWGSTHPIDSVAPATSEKCPAWPAAQVNNCYYIDNTNPSATDTNNLYGYPNKPRATVPAGTYTAGAYVEIHGGPYTTEKEILLNGAADKIIWFRGVAGAMPDMRAKISIADSKYAIIENLDFNNFSGGAISLSGSMAANNVSIRNCMFRNLTFPGSSSAVLGATPSQNGSIHDVVFFNNLFQDIGNYLALDDEDFHAINPSLWGRKPPTTVYNIWSLSNTAIRISGSLNQFNGDQRDATVAANEVPPRPITNTNLQHFHHMYSGKNLMYQSRQGLGAPKFTTDAVYSQNAAYSNYSTASAAGTGVAYQEGSRYVWIIFNKFYDLTYGIRSSNTNFPGDTQADLRAYMIGNTIYNIHNNYGRSYTHTNQYKPAQAIGFEKGKYKRYVIDNTFYNVGGGVNIGNQLATDKTELSGNVFAGINGVDDTGDMDFHFSLLSPEGAAGTFLDRSFFQPRADNGLVTFKWAGALPSTNINSITALRSSSVAQCQNCLEGDPQFTDPQNYNLRPKAGSPLIGKNIRHAVYDEFEARYGISIAYDFDGNPRPTSGPWTIGAFEYKPAAQIPVADTTPPSAPSGVSVE